MMRHNRRHLSAQPYVFGRRINIELFRVQVAADVSFSPYKIASSFWLTPTYAFISIDFVTAGHMTILVALSCRLCDACAWTRDGESPKNDADADTRYVLVYDAACLESDVGTRCCGGGAGFVSH